MIDHDLYGEGYAEVPDRAIRGIAREFRETAVFLNERVAQLPVVTPVEMIASFGLELYLKSLNARLLFRQETAWLQARGVYRVYSLSEQLGHRLTKLFDELEQCDRDALQVAYTANQVNPHRSTIREALAIFDQLFERCRYRFEPGNEVGETNFTDLIGLLTLVGDYVDRMEERRVFRGALPPARIKKKIRKSK